MPFLARPLRQLSLFILQFIIQSGCAGPAQLAEPSTKRPFMEGGTSAVYPGPLDSKNHYLSNVAIHTSAKRADGSEHCSGVLVSPREILTAGHCLCMKKKVDTAAAREEVARRLREAMPSTSMPPAESAAIEGLRARILEKTDTVTDSSHCATLVRVEVVEYLPSKSTLTSSLRQSRYIGKVIHPHPQLLVLDDASGTTWFREADLAVIHLAVPVNERFRPIKLPESEVQSGNPIVMVGHGFGEDGDTTTEFGDRHYGESVIASVERLASGSVKFLARAPSQGTKPAPRVYSGDSGGGCFSKTDDRVLVGVISAYGSDGESSIFTSVFAYRDWLKKELSHEGAATIAP